MNVHHFAITFNDLFIVHMLIATAAAAATSNSIQTGLNILTRLRKEEKKQ